LGVWVWGGVGGCVFVGGGGGGSERERVEGDVFKHFQYKSRVPIQPSFHTTCNYKAFH